MTNKHSSDDFFAEFDAAFYTDGYKITGEYLKAGISEEGLLDVCEELYYSIKNNRTGKMKMQQLLHYKDACPLLGTLQEKSVLGSLK